MPISSLIKIREISRDEYHRLDYRVMGVVYGIHNDLGRLYDEKIYRRALANRCRRIGLKADEEVAIKVVHRDFEKKYLIDLIINDSIIYELKSASGFNPKHRGQLLNYIFLAGAYFGKLVNMGTASVEDEYITTNISTEERYKINLDDKAWKALGKDSKWLRELLVELVSDWGMFLSLDLYQEAVQFFYNAERPLLQEVRIEDKEYFLGVQKAYLLDGKIGVFFSGLTVSRQSFQKHLERFLRYSGLKAIHWINFNHHNLTLKTLID